LAIEIFIEPFRPVRRALEIQGLSDSEERIVITTRRLDFRRLHVETYSRVRRKGNWLLGAKNLTVKGGVKRRHGSTSSWQRDGRFRRSPERPPGDEKVT